MDVLRVVDGRRGLLSGDEKRPLSDEVAEEVLDNLPLTVVR